MKKFKLIKEYPGSPRKGHILIPCSREGLQGYYESLEEDEDCFRINMMHSSDIFPYPEFWEKVIEKKLSNG